MKEIKQDCYKGTRIILGDKRVVVNHLIGCLGRGFQEISIPIIQPQTMFSGKVGEENNNLMFNFQDRGGRDICLAPEYTSVIQNLAKTTFKQERDLKLFYVQECFRGEKPQLGRYRQFTQFGVEIVNPTQDYNQELSELLTKMLPGFIFTTGVPRGLDYYKEGKGFEVRNQEGLQIAGGGEYEGGIGFAIGVDRLI